MKHEFKTSFTLGTIGVVVFAFATLFALLTMQFVARPQMTHLHLNPYAIISIVSALGTLVILTRIVASNSHSAEASWFILVLLGQILFAASEAFQRCSTDRPSVIFWTHLSGAGAVLLGVGVFLFAMEYTTPSRARPAFLPPLLLWVTVVVALFYTTGNILFNNNPDQLHLYPWGYNSDAGRAFFISLLWVLVPGIASGFLLLRFRSRNDNPLLRKQSLLFAAAILAPMIVGGVTDGLLPSLQINVLPPLATLFELITCVVIFYGISRYQFFQINPEVLAENVLTTMNEAVVVTRSDFTVEYINKEAERLLHMANEDLPPTFIHTLFSPDSWPKIHAYIKGDVTNDDDFGDVMLLDKSGNQTPVRVFISTLREGNFQAFIFVISDISDIVESYHRLESDSNRIRTLLAESHRLEEQLKLEKNNVEQTVALRTNELRKAQEELKETDKLKTEFIMIGSHNLRTPITIMSSSLEMLKDTQNDQERRDLISSLQNGVNRLRDFVEDMVTIVSLEAGTGQRREPVRIIDLLDPVVTETKALATTKPAVTFTTNIQNGEATIQANSIWLRGAIRNLLSNAFKFTENGTVTLQANMQGTDYIIAVTDTGIGIAPDELPKLFTKFHRSTDTLTYEYEGKGIGLYLTKLIVDEHGGVISAESSLGSGSTFSIRLPLKNDAAPTPPVTPAA